MRVRLKDDLGLDFLVNLGHGTARRFCYCCISKKKLRVPRKVKDLKAARHGRSINNVTFRTSTVRLYCTEAPK